MGVGEGLGWLGEKVFRVEGLEFCFWGEISGMGGSSANGLSPFLGNNGEKQGVGESVGVVEGLRQEVTPKGQTP